MNSHLEPKTERPNTFERVELMLISEGNWISITHPAFKGTGIGKESLIKAGS